MSAAKSGDQEVRSVRCLWNTLKRQDFPLDSLTTRQLQLVRAKTTPQRKNCTLHDQRMATGVRTEKNLGPKMEIPAYYLR